MDVRAYIESGILELYVMEALPPAESREVEALAAQYPGIQAEIDAIRKTMAAYGATQATPPPPELKERILAQVRAQTPASPRRPSRGRTLVWAAALTAVALLAGYFLITCLQTGKELRELTTRQQALVSELEQVRGSRDDLRQKMDLLLNQDTKTIELDGLPISPQSQVVVYWNPAQQATFLLIKNLPPPPPGKQYQLWAIVDKNPVDAGVFDSVAGSLQTMKAIARAEAFAVTLENAGGSPTPTLDQMYVLGEIG